MAGQGELSRPSFWRVVGVSVTAVAVVLWIWADRPWSIAIPLVGGLLLAHLLIPIFPQHWRDGASGLARVAIAVLAAGWLFQLTTALAWGVAVGVGCLVCVTQLRAVLPPWAQWTAGGVGRHVWTGGMAIRTRRPARREAAEREDREFRVAEMRPDQPLAMFHLVIKAIHENDPALMLHVHPRR
jgi:hypothetical protein